MRRRPRKNCKSGPGHTNAVHLEQNEANYFRPHHCIIFQLVSPVHTKKFENDKNELDLGLCMCEINVQLRRRNTSYKSPQLVAQHCFVVSFPRCFPFFTWRDQLDPQQKHLLRVEEMRRADWLIFQVTSKFVA